MNKNIEFNLVLDFSEEEVRVVIDDYIPYDKSKGILASVEYRVFLEDDDVSDELIGEDAIQVWHAAHDYMEKYNGITDDEEMEELDFE